MENKVNNKLMLGASAAVVISSSVLALMQVEPGTLMESGRLQARSEMGFETSEVSAMIEQLKKKYPHIKRPCLYGTAMVMNDQADKIPTLLETETKCIHTLVIAEGQEEHFYKQVKEQEFLNSEIAK